MREEMRNLSRVSITVMSGALVEADDMQVDADGAEWFRVSSLGGWINRHLPAKVATGVAGVTASANDFVVHILKRGFYDFPRKYRVVGSGVDVTESCETTTAVAKQIKEVRSVPIDVEIEVSEERYIHSMDSGPDTVICRLFIRLPTMYAGWITANSTALVLN